MPRISIVCDKKLHDRITKCLPWGTQAQAIRTVVELLCQQIEKDGVIVIANLISGTYIPLVPREEREKRV